MLGGVKFCGGCNPRYDRGKALAALREYFKEKVVLVNAEEGVEYDFLLVIGGCTNCCASYCQYKAKKDIILMWSKDHLENAINKIEKLEV